MSRAADDLKDFQRFSPKKLPVEEPLAPGHRACQGCGEVLALRQVMKALGNNVIVVSATGCMEIISSAYPQSAWRVPWLHVAFENAAAVASGVEAAHKAMIRKGRIEEKNTTFLAIAGDGGTADIGIQALSGALERGHNFIYVCLDNEAYMNTGIQRSSSTPYGAGTTTSPPGKESIGQLPCLLCGSDEQGQEGFFGERTGLLTCLFTLSYRLAVRCGGCGPDWPPGGADQDLSSLRGDRRQV
ncbi:MAG: thiamine pyrophosphate-dependent enzyme [Syntrophobacterales bacterium]